MIYFLAIVAALWFVAWRFKKMSQSEIRADQAEEQLDRNEDRDEELALLRNKYRIEPDADLERMLMEKYGVRPRNDQGGDPPVS